MKNAATTGKESLVSKTSIEMHKNDKMKAKAVQKPAFFVFAT
jgi:hypothetical protein